MTALRSFTQRGRITSLHGVLLPPKKRQVVNRYITVRFVIVGTIPSKKNMIWADSNLNTMLKKLYSFQVVKDCVDWLRQHLRAFVRNSKKYKDWFEEQREVVLKQAALESQRYEKFGLIFPLDNVSVKVYHYWDNHIEKDLTNKLDSLNDLFVTCGIVVNDNWQVIGKIESEGEYYGGDILKQITTIDITQRFS